MSDGPGGKRISFEVKGTPLVQQRAKMSGATMRRTHFYHPSAKYKKEFVTTVRKEMIACGQTTFPFFLDSTAILVNAKYVLPRPKKDFVKNKNKARLQLISGAVPFPHGKDINNLNKFTTDALESILYANDTNIVTGEVKKCYTTNISETAGWCELKFLKWYASLPTTELT
jgi:Holliday junction resolvase RusA-like endonuclease